MKYFEAISVASFILGGFSLIVGDIFLTIGRNYVFQAQDLDYNLAKYFFVIAIVFGVIGLIDRRRRRSSSSD